MWCAICQRHYENIIRNIYEPYKDHIKGGDFAIYIVDYVNSNTGEAEKYRQRWNIPDDITVLVDIDDTLTYLYGGTMGITVVIDKDGIVQINQDYDAAEEDIKEKVGELLL
jgi:hypothetical protein